MLALLEGFGDGGLVGFEAEYLNSGARFFLEHQASVDDLGVVEDEQGVVGQEVRDVAEGILGYCTVLENKQF